MERYEPVLLPAVENLHRIDIYEAHGGYERIRKAFTMSPAKVIAEVKASGLRGRGGAAFPTGLKWSFMPAETDRPKYLCVNADESEPGSFKDRQILERNPHLLIEGILIAGWAMGIGTAYIYIRGEYESWARMVERALAEAHERGYIGARMRETFGTDYAIDIHVHRGAGAYICGEESSLMNSIEGLRPYPRIKPPFPAQRGLWGCPTTINNVETIANVPVIIERGAAWYASVGAEKQPGPILYGISGHVNRPGVYEFPTGMLLTELIYDVAGGVPGGKCIKMVIPGGTSMPPLRGDRIEGVRMDVESLKAVGCGIGTASLIVMDEDTDLLDVLTRIASFYWNESCGQCTPCREGTGWMFKILQRLQGGDGGPGDLDLLVSVAGNIEGNTVCALGEAAAWPVKYTIERFRSELEEHVRRHATKRSTGGPIRTLAGSETRIPISSQRENP
ncbi:MAG: NADH-quinone oxidoreductase subunit NuoF [Bacteroidota bacterium]|nr:NADH-quinone oxidoreductase subunit NuoF [Bacteroidota bacterium]